MEEVGLSMAMGAFLAGVLLASSEYRHALESDIEPRQPGGCKSWCGRI